MRCKFTAFFGISNICGQKKDRKTKNRGRNAKNVYLRRNATENMTAMKRLFKDLTILTIIGLASVNASAQKTDEDHSFEIAKNLEIFHEIVSELDRYYVDTISPAKTIETGIQAMLRGHLAGKHLIDAACWLVYHPLCRGNDLDSLTQRWGLFHHIHSNIEHDSSLLAV